MQSLLENKTVLQLTIVAVAVAIMLPVFVYGTPFGTGDFIHHLQIAIGYSDSISDGIWLPNWFAAQNNGYGAVTPRFYPPLIGYTLAIFQTLTGDWQTSIFSAFALWSAVGGIGMFVWTNDLFESRIQAAIAALLFVLAPYHLNQFYNSFMWGEFAAMSAMPFAFHFSRLVADRVSFGRVAGLAVSIAAIILANLPQTIVAALGIGIYFAFNLDRSRFVGQIAGAFAAIVTALGLTAFFWVRMAIEMKNLIIAQPNTDPLYDYRNHFLLSEFTFDDGGIWFATLLLGVTVGLAIVSLAAAGRLRAVNSSPSIRQVALVTIFAAVMIVPLSRPLWDFAGPLQRIQFPWRFLSLVSIGASVLTAFAAGALISRQNPIERPRRLIIAGLIAIFAVFAIKQVAVSGVFIDRAYLAELAGTSRTAKGLIHWHPVWTGEGSFAPAPAIDAGSRRATVVSATAESREFEIAAGPERGARAALLFYPGWEATVNGSPVAVNRTPDGAVSIDLPPETSRVELKFVEPNYTAVSRMISLGALALTIFGALAGTFIEKRKNEI